MYDEDVKVPHGVDLPVTSPENLYLMPGEHAVVRIQYGHTNREQEVVWAERGDRRITKNAYQARHWLVAIKVVNVSNYSVWIDMKTPLTRIVQYDLNPDLQKSGWLGYKISQFKMLNHGELVDAGTQTEEDLLATTRMDIATQVSESQLGSHGCDPGEGKIQDDDQGGTSVEMPPEPTTEFEEHQGGGMSSEIHTEYGDSGLLPEKTSCTLLEKLEMEYESCMRISAEELDLEPGEYIRIKSEMLAQLRDLLVMLPELSEFHPECNIDQADVGVPVGTYPEDESRMGAILKRHRKIFLGDGNAAPAPARGVVCDRDVGEAKPIALRLSSIGPHVAVKVYELFKKVLENNLIEHSESQWASPIVIVLKKNGVDIRMCIDYRLVNNFIQPFSYPLPFIDDLLVGFEKALWFMSLNMASGFWAIKMTERAKLISAFICPFGHF
ncbi:reverse transcriptase, partial [Phytophthora megakarya]